MKLMFGLHFTSFLIELASQLLRLNFRKERERRGIMFFLISPWFITFYVASSGPVYYGTTTFSLRCCFFFWISENENQGL